MGIEIKEIKVEDGQKLIPFKSSVSKQQRVRLDAPKDSVSFTGGVGSPTKVIDPLKEMLEVLLPKHRKAIDLMESAKWLKGELGSIIITAVGTGLVAPVFIGLNPFVKAPKDATPEQKREVTNTKLYTAMRQPISAALAILFQASILKYIDRILDGVFNNPKYSRKVSADTDQAIFNTESYIKYNEGKKLNKNYGKRPSVLSAMFSKEAKVRRAVYNEKLKKAVEKEKDGIIDRAAKLFEKENKILINEQSVIEGAKRYVDGETMADVISRQINSYIKDAQALKKEEGKVADYAIKAKLLIENEDYFRGLATKLPIDEINKFQVREQITKVLPYKEISKTKDKELLYELVKKADKNIGILLDHIGKDNPEITTILENLRKELVVDKNNPSAGNLVEMCKTQASDAKNELKGLYKQVTETVKAEAEKITDNKALKDEVLDILKKSEDLRANRVSRILQRISSIKEMCGSKGYEYERYKKAMEKKLGVVTDKIIDLEACKKEIVAKGSLDEKGVKDAIAKIAKILTFDKADSSVAPVLKDTDVFEEKAQAGELLSKIYKDITKTYKKVIDSSYKGISQYTKMFIGAAITLPITCTALNWVYPRFMELVFPRLAGVKKAPAEPQVQKNGGDK